MRQKCRAALVAAALVAVETQATTEQFGRGSNQFTMDFQEIGHLGNKANTSCKVKDGYLGRVSYEYRIGIHEVTIDQFIKSGVGDDDEKYWNSTPDTAPLNLGIQAPATQVSWYEAAKFCNWLTSSNALHGAYVFKADGSFKEVDREKALKKYKKMYLLPTENEWFKAAYYRAEGYTLYATGNDDPDPTAHARYSVTGSPYTAPWAVGTGSSPENNKTFDMNGNVAEWIEGAFDGVLNDPKGKRVVRGGAFNSDVADLRAVTRKDLTPGTEAADLGFRVVMISRELMTEEEWETRKKIAAGLADQDTVTRLEAVDKALSSNDVSGASGMIAALSKDLKEARSYENSVTKVKVGYVSFAPYTIKDDPANPGALLLDESSTDGSAFVEVAFADRYAWRTSYTPEELKKSSFSRGLGLTPWGKNHRPWDWEAKLGFVLGNSSGDGEANGSTIAAGGDMYAEVAAGNPVYFNRQSNAVQVSVGPEVVATLVTQKKNFDIAGNYKAVMAFVAQGRDTEEKRSWRMLARIGVGWVEEPQLEGTNNWVEQDSNGRPVYHTEFGTYTQVLFDLPAFETSTLSLSGEFWNGLDVNPWSAYISYSMSFSGIKDFLKLNK